FSHVLIDGILSPLYTVDCICRPRDHDPITRFGIKNGDKVTAQSKFKLLYFEQDNGRGYSIALQVTDDMKTKNRADRAGLVSAGEKEVRGTVPSVSKVEPPKFELQMGCK
ncbi:hypothetical protein Tco_0470647, partial [Tanacetum coccineum]